MLWRWRMEAENSILVRKSPHMNHLQDFGENMSCPLKIFHVFSVQMKRLSTLKESRVFGKIVLKKKILKLYCWLGLSVRESIKIYQKISLKNFRSKLNSILFSFSTVALTIQMYCLHFHVYFRISLSIFITKTCWDFNLDHINCKDQLWIIDILTILRLWIHHHDVT